MNIDCVTVQIAKLEMGKDDVLVIQPDEPLSQHNRQMLTFALQSWADKVGFKNRVLILQHGVSMSVLGKEDSHI